MANKDIVVMGASYGGVEALKVLVSGLPKGFHALCFPCAAPYFDCSKPVARDIDEGRAAPGVFPGGFEPIEQGHIYVAPPGYHMRP